LIYCTTAQQFLFAVFALADLAVKALVVGFGCCTEYKSLRAVGNTLTSLLIFCFIGVQQNTSVSLL
jgi:hypothetical protein